ncbi:DUF4331 family protein [Marinobacter gelidimuriae]|uniref:DUF4331 family protein n=1 Tax=Marinobacter gelidimuriae TaxID=2739064 RepID=UPI00036BF871|nr:DUF4331 family protein [Marinobacter gelidimuriae]
MSAGLSHASSHREAPFITEVPKVDGTDFYMFRSYEPNREDFVTLIANYLPLQDAYDGPNYFDMDEDAVYEIHIDNSGNAQENLTFRFQFSNTLNDIQLPVGPDGDKKMVSVPLKNIGNATNSANVQLSQEYTVSVIRGDRRTGTVETATSFALEVPTQCLIGSAVTTSDQPVIGAWTTASVRQARIINPAPSADGKGATVEGGAWTQVSRLGMPLVNAIRRTRDVCHTTFTLLSMVAFASTAVAHKASDSFTLALAALDIVRLPIALAALNVIWLFLGRKTWKLAFAFGLVHGFGFASVLGDLTGGTSSLAIALVGFNLGVELGQLGLLIVGFPLLYALAHVNAYQRVVVPLLLVGVGAISLMWVVERAGTI